ncbi:MAG: protein kinase [Gammaproteobacteria bacterium]|nr:protein kinase [Gammaproteobacteria bacterium]
MAKFGNLLFNRTLNQFLECGDLDSKKGLSLAEKLKDSVSDNLEKVLTMITQVEEPHREALKNICRESVEGFSEEYFLEVLSHDDPDYRAAASDILARASAVDNAKLFRQLHEPDASPAEVIEVLASQKHLLQPADIINNAIKLEAGHAIQLLKLLQGTEVPIDLSKLSVQLDKIDDPEFKIPMLRYLGSVNHEKIPLIAAKYLTDSNKVVVLEALKVLDQMTIDYDVSILLPHIESMSGIELELSLKVIAKQADASLVPHLTDFLTTKSAELNEFFARVVVVNADKANFEKFLRRLSVEDDWTQQQAIASLQKFSNENLSEVARELVNHEQEFVRNAAQQLVINLLGDEDLDKIEEFALSDNWQVRERAIQSLAKSSNRGAIAILKKMVESYPDDYVLALRAVKQLGFGKGLEICFDGLKNSQANVQRASLETIEAITTEKHAVNVRDNILWSLPVLTNEMREFAKMLMSQITKDFGLPDIQIDERSNTSTGVVDLLLYGSGTGTTSRPPERVSPLDRLKPGSVWMDRYHIKEEIGRGAMGRVMLAEDDMVDELLILKFMLPELTVGDQSTERFKREVKYARKVSHRNVIRVHDILQKDELSAISMEYFKSRGLEAVLKEVKFFNTLDGLKILHQIASGMAAAHEQEVIHRDLKPSNILMDEKWLVKIVDFGIASAGTASEATLTQTGSIIGSPAYLAPERAEGADADVRSDIYSLGVIAYYMFSGQLPYSGKPMEVLAKHRDGNAPPIMKVNDESSPEVSRLIVKLMAVDPAARPQTMEAVRDEARALVEQFELPDAIA